MNSVVLIVGGMLFGWFLEWLYLYVTKTAPKKNEIKQLQAALQHSEQGQSEATAKMTGEIEALQAQVAGLTAQNETVAAEADRLREALAVVHQSVEVEQTGARELDAVAPVSVLDDDAELEKEFIRAMEAELTSETSSKNDDMTLLTGVGPKTATLLNEAGLVSFSQLADMDAESLQVLLQTNNIPHSKAKVSNWPGQAGQLVKGE